MKKAIDGALRESHSSSSVRDRGESDAAIGIALLCVTMRAGVGGALWDGETRL
jgi:hypothetical protein